MSSFFRSHRWLFVAAFLGAIVTALLWQRTLLIDVPDPTIGKAEVERIADTYARAQGFPTEHFIQQAYVNPLSSVFSIAALKDDLTTAELRRALIEDKVPLRQWWVRWVQDVPLNAPQEGLTLRLDFSGKVNGFERVFYDTTKFAKISQDSAKTLAANFLRLHHGISISDGYALKDSKTDEKSNYAVHTFVWTKREALNDKDSVTYEWMVSFRGATLQHFDRLIEVPPQVDELVQAELSLEASFTGFLPTLLSFLAMIYLAVLFLRKYHQGEVGVRSGLYLFIFSLVVGVVGFLNVLPSLSQGVSFGVLPRVANTLLFIAFGIVFGYLINAGLIFFAWTVGESDARVFKTESRIAAMDALLQRQFFTQPVGEGVLSGSLFGIALIGIALVFLFTVQTFFGGWAPRAGIGIALSAVVVPFAGLPELVTPLLATVLLRLFLQQRLAQTFKNEWLAAAVTGIFSAIVLHTQLPIYPYFYNILGAVLIGILLSVFSVRYGILAAMVADFVSGWIVGRIIPLCAASAPEFFIAGALEAAVLLGIVIFAIAAIRKGRTFEFKGSALPSHIERITQRARMAQELEIAKETQLRLLPQYDPLVSGLDISGICLPALEVGGDYYDYITLGDKKFAIAVGDVSGKGVPAAMYMTLVKGMVQLAATFISEPKRMLSEINAQVCKNFKRGTFISMTYAVIDLEKRRLTYARAGHNPLLLVGRAGDATPAPMPKGMALGLVNGSTFSKFLEETSVSFQSGDTLVFYTDGFSEAKDSDGNEFGETRLLESLRRHSSRTTAKDIIKNVCRDVQVFTGSAPQHDDMTMVAIKVK